MLNLIRADIYNSYLMVIQCHYLRLEPQQPVVSRYQDFLFD